MNGLNISSENGGCWLGQSRLLAGSLERNGADSWEGKAVMSQDFVGSGQWHGEVMTIL